MAHTPGPWTTPHDDSPYWAQAAAGERNLPVSSEAGIVAEVRWQRREHAGNARLIAAAPELLEACLATLRLNDIDLLRDCPAVIAARAAIAKATGNNNESR